MSLLPTLAVAPIVTGAVHACAVALLGCAEPSSAKQVPIGPAYVSVPSVVERPDTLNSVRVERLNELFAFSDQDALTIGEISIKKVTQFDDLRILCRFSNMRELAIQRVIADELVFTCELPELLSLKVAGSSLRVISATSPFPNLAQLHLRDVSIFNAHNLPAMPSLQSLSIESVTRFSWSALAGWDKLESLSVRRSSFSDEDVRSLCDLQLEMLDVSYTKVTTLGCIGSLETLRSLKVDGLNLSHAAIREIPSSVTYLSMQGPQTIDPQRLSHLVQLEELHADRASLSEAARFDFLQLKKLSLRESDVHHLILGSSVLESLDARGASQLRVVECVAGCAPNEIDLSNTAVLDLPPTIDYRSVMSLSVSDTRIDNIDALGVAVHMSDLDISHTDVSDLSALSAVRRIRRLNITCTDVVELSPLTSTSSIRSLDASGTGVTMLPAVLLRTLTQLDLYHTPVTKVDGEISRCALRRADFSYTHFTDIHYLSACAELDSLSVCGVGGEINRLVAASSALRSSVDVTCHAIGFIDPCRDPDGH